MAKYNRVGYNTKFKDADEVSKRIDEYFKQCDENDEPYTITGLALSLGTSRNVLCDYEKCVDDLNILKSLDYDVKVRLSNTIKRAKEVCENYAERKLLDPKITKSPIGYIFALKNYDWKDKTETVIENKTIDVELVD